MLTPRGHFLLLLGTVGAGLGVFNAQELLALVSLSVLVWLFFEWVQFRWRADVQLRGLSCERLVNGSSSPTGRFWARRIVRVAVRVSSNSSMRIPWLRFEDVLPENMECSDGGNVVDGYFQGADPFEFSYTATPRGVGSAILPGVTVRFGDLQGLFFIQRFLPARQSFRVLPTCIDVDTAHPTTKQVNSLPPPGIHRMQRAGMGSELLELREYVPGDPPKSIAWKVSAKRDVLMTRQYESEVPVRTTLFIDASFGTRLGAFGLRPIDQIILLAGSIARSTMALRDPVGLVCFDNAHAKTVPSGIGERHFYRILDQLTECAEPARPPLARLTTPLLEHTWATLQDRHPELLLPRVNQLPFRLFPIRPFLRSLSQKRARLTAALTELYGLPVDAPSQLEQDDLRLAALCQRFLTESGLAWTWPVVERRGREVHDWDARFDTLTAALTSAVAHGRDNELFVLLLDLVDYTGSLERLKQVIRLARARHHRVVVICPWPDETLKAKEVDSSEELDTVEDLVERAERARLVASGERLKRELRRLGVPVAFTADRRTIQLTLIEANLARNGRSTTGIRR
jgi:uncharacterized protein (DUF58 family)